MKKRTTLSLVSILVCMSLFSQTRLAMLKNSLKTNSTDIKDIIPIVNKENDELAIFIADAKNVYAYKFNNQFELVSQITSETKNRKHKILLGSGIDKDNYCVFLSNTSYNKFAAVNFSFIEKKSSLNEFNLPSNEVFIQNIMHGNTFYILTASKNIGSIYLYTFTVNGKYKKAMIDLDYNLLLNEYNTPVNIADMLIHEESIIKIEKDTPNSIESASKKTKMYLRGDDIVLSFDHNKQFTQIITINIPSKKLSKKTIDKPLMDISDGRKKSNSFIYDDKIITIAATKAVFSMHILNYQTGKLYREYAFTQDEPITFKNSSIIQEGGTYSSYRELEKTKKFLRKITAKNIGVSVIKNNNDYQFTIGGYIEQNSTGPALGYGVPMSFGNVSLFFNPTMMAFNSFTNTKSTRIECLFDTDYNHVPTKEISNNVFDKINQHVSAGKDHKTVFRYKDYFIQGVYNSYQKTYYLTKFTK